MADYSADREDGVTHPGSSHGRTLSRRRVLASITAASVGGGVVTSRAGAATTGTERIRDEAWVETPVDTNDSGESDRVYVRIARPESTTGDERVPVVATASPYYGEQTHSDSTPAMKYDRAVDPAASADGDTAAGSRARESASESVPSHGGSRPASLRDDGVLEQRYVPQEYAIARISSLGTHRSTGCYTAAGPPTIEALEAVVDWFNGRATAYDSRSGGEPVTADWTSGRTGLIGASANGELANGLATTGVDGLEAVVPQSANNGQFSLFRSNGTPISVVRDGGERMADLGTWVQAGNARRSDCDHWTDRVEAGQDRETGDYNDFWHEREFLPDADAVEAGVLLTHAVDDPIVKPNNVADWYELLDDADVPVRLWLHEGGHTSPGGEAWRDLLDRWWAYWLKDADNGVLDEDPVTVVRGGAAASQGSRETYESWPVPDARATSVRFAAGGATAGEVTVTEPAPAEESFVDDPSVAATELVAASESDHRLRYETPPLGRPVHVSGRVVPRLTASFDEPTVLSAALVAYGDGDPAVVTRGWADPLNRPSYGEYDSPVAYKESLRESRPLEVGEPVELAFPLQATDHVFAPGTRIGLVVYASDRAVTLHPPGNATVTLSLAECSVSVPVVGGESAFTEAVAADPPDEDGRANGTADADDAASPPGASGPGFGIGAAVGALGSLGYLLGRRGRTDGWRARADDPRTGADDGE